MAGFYFMSTRMDKKEYKKPIAPLYAFVYGARVVSVAVFLLLTGFILQPVQQAFAAIDGEGQDTIVDQKPTEVSEGMSETQSSQVELESEEGVGEEAVSGNQVEETEAVTETALISTEVLPSEQMIVATETSEVITESEDVTNEDILNESGLIENNDADFTDVDTLASSSVTSSVDDVIGPSSSSTGEFKEESVEESEEVVGQIVTSPEINEAAQTILSESDSSSSDVVVENVVVTKFVNNDNLYTFNKNQCVSVGNGTYHCSTEAETIKNNNEQVFSSQGEHGNFEIFMQTSDGLKQLTDNYFEDTAPKYDTKSERLVWQRLIDGRYQIVIYSLQSKEEKVLTSGSKNNMEPAVSGENIVWQAWDGNDWEIMLFDGSKIKQITNNEVQDIGPVVEDKFVVWTVVGDKEQVAQVYSLETGTIKDIADNEGGEIKNPRFILVYDTKFDNGDIITRGFDPETGISTSLAATPAPVAPIEIPSTDSTGETRALIQNKSASREDFSELGDIESNDNATSTTGTSTIATDNDELIITSIMEEVATSSPLVLTEYDLIVTPYENAATSTQLVDSDTD